MSWLNDGLLILLGFGGGFLVAGGVVALVVGLGIVSRYVGITHTGRYVWLYEDCILAGGMAGTLLTVYRPDIPLGLAGLIVLGVFSGIYVGSWIMALAEVLNIFPVFARRFGIVKGTSAVVIAIAAGKICGSLYHFYMRW